MSDPFAKAVADARRPEARKRKRDACRYEKRRWAEEPVYNDGCTDATIGETHEQIAVQERIIRDLQAENERLSEIKRMVEHCQKMQGDDQLACFMESAVTAFNDRDHFEADAKALQAECERLRAMVGERGVVITEAVTPPPFDVSDLIAEDREWQAALATARREALEEALLIAWREAGHGLEPNEVEEGSYYDGWDAGIEAYKAAIRALKDRP